MRPILAALLIALASALACAKPPPALVIHPVEARLLVGQTTVVLARVEGGCSDLTSLSVQVADGSAAPTWLDLKVDHFATAPATASYPIANPGEGKPFDVGGGFVYDPTGAITTHDGPYWATAPGGRLIEAPWNGFQLAFTAAAGAPSTPVALQVKIGACGASLDEPLTLSVAGGLDLGAFCGWTSGEPCTSDAGCTRAGDFGEVCVPAGSGGTLAMPRVTCADPVPGGARCGCITGVCAWR